MLSQLTEYLLPSYFVLKLLISFGVLCALFSFELFLKGYDNSAFKRILFNRSKSTQLDIACAIIYALGIAPAIAVILSFGLGQLIPLSIRSYFGFNLIQSIPSEFIQFGIYVLLFDFLFYWKHRLAHKINWWWEIHKVHHSATEMNIITSNRQHPFDEALKEIFMCLPLAIAGAPPSSYVFYRVFSQTQQFIQHSNFTFSWGWIGKYLLVPPAAHLIHHSIHPRHIDRNFGNFTPIWDHLFRTWHSGLDVNNVKIGVHNNYFNDCPWHINLWKSYLFFWKELRLSSQKFLTKNN